MHPPLRQVWRVAFPGAVSYPVVSGGMVYVTTVANPTSARTFLYALSLTTGRVRWKRGLGVGFQRTNVACELVGSTLTAVSRSGFGRVLWTCAGDEHLQTAPLVLGSTVWMGSSWGRLYGISTRGPGQGVWSSNLHRPIYGPDDTRPRSR